MKAALALLLLLGFQEPPAADGVARGKMPWRADPGRALRRASLEKRGLLFYFGDASPGSKVMADLLFTSDNFLAAAEPLIPVLLDCSDETRHADLKSKYDVKGAPTLILIDPDGKKIAEVTAPTADEAAEQVGQVGMVYPGKDSFWAPDWEEAVRLAREGRKPLAVYFFDPKDDFAAATGRLAADAKPLLKKFVWIDRTATMDEKDPQRTTFQFEALPCLGVLDPREKEMEARPLGMYEIYKDTDADRLKELLERALKKHKDAKPRK